MKDGDALYVGIYKNDIMFTKDEYKIHKLNYVLNGQDKDSSVPVKSKNIGKEEETQ